MLMLERYLRLKMPFFSGRGGMSLAFKSGGDSLLLTTLLWSLALFPICDGKTSTVEEVFKSEYSRCSHNA
jgi:hypothetical protein